MTKVKYKQLCLTHLYGRINTMNIYLKIGGIKTIGYTQSLGTSGLETVQLWNLTDKMIDKNDSQRTKQECSSPSHNHPVASTHLLSLPTHQSINELLVNLWNERNDSNTIQKGTNIWDYQYQTFKRTSRIIFHICW